MTRITNHIVHVCALLTNFQPALVSPSDELNDSDVESYFEQLESDFSSEESASET